MVPTPLTLSIEPLTRFVIAKLVVVAFAMDALVALKDVVVAFVVEKFVEKRFPAVRAVEEANGKVEAALAVEVITPLLPMVVVAVPPIASWDALKTFAKRAVPEALVQVRPPLKLMSVVVALLANG